MEYECCICKGWFDGWGNNPWPVDKRPDAICCDKCNLDRVIPARLKQAQIDYARKYVIYGPEQSK